MEEIKQTQEKPIQVKPCCLFLNKLSKKQRIIASIIIGIILILLLINRLLAKSNLDKKTVKELTATESPSPTEELTTTPVQKFYYPTITTAPTDSPTNTSVPPTSIPPTSIPPTSIPPTSVPPTSTPGLVPVEPTSTPGVN